MNDLILVRFSYNYYNIVPIPQACSYAEMLPLKRDDVTRLMENSDCGGRSGHLAFQENCLSHRARMALNSFLNVRTARSAGLAR